MKPPLSYVPLLPATIAVIVVSLTLHIFSSPPCVITESYHYRGMVTHNRINDTGQHLTVSTKLPDGKSTMALLTYPTVKNTIQPGDSIAFTAKLKHLTAPDKHENDFSLPLKRKGIEYVAFIRPDSLDLIGCSKSIYWQVRRFRPLINDILKQSALSTPTCEFLIATLTGDTDILPEETRTRFSSSGVAHVLALSGLHVGIIALIIVIILYPLRLLHRHLPAIISIIALWGYAILTGLSPSVTRAVIMGTTISLSLILQRQYSSFNALLLAAIIILLADPLALSQPGFQLSFCAVASILLFSWPLNNLRIKRRPLHYLLSLVTVTISATLGTAIISACHFHIFPVYFLFANIPVIILLPFILTGGTFVLLLTAAGIDCPLLCHVIDALYSLTDIFLSRINSLPGATIKGLYFSGWAALPYFAALASLAAAFIYHRALWYTLSVIFTTATILCIVMTQPDYPEEEFFITRSTYETSVIYRHRTSAYLITTAPPQKARNVIASHQQRFSDFLASRGVDSLQTAPEQLTLGNLDRHGNRLQYRGKTFCFIYSNDMPPADTTSYAVVCRGFRGDILNIARRYHPDTILLSNDLHPRRHDRYRDTLLLHKIPHRSLKRHQNTNNP